MRKLPVLIKTYRDIMQEKEKGQPESCPLVRVTGFEPAASCARVAVPEKLPLFDRCPSFGSLFPPLVALTFAAQSRRRFCLLLMVRAPAAKKANPQHNHCTSFCGGLVRRRRSVYIRGGGFLLSVSVHLYDNGH